MIADARTCVGLESYYKSFMVHCFKELYSLAATGQQIGPVENTNRTNPGDVFPYPCYKRIMN